jgi:hypothetical protein
VLKKKYTNKNLLIYFYFFCFEIALKKYTLQFTMIITNGMMCELTSCADSNCELVNFSSPVTWSHKWTLCKANGFSSYKVVFLYRNLSAHDKGRGEKGRCPRVYILEMGRYPRVYILKNG